MSVVSPVFKESFYSIFFHIVGDFFGYLLINLFIQFNTKNDNRRRILQPFFLLSRILYDIFAVNSYSYIIEPVSYTHLDVYKRQPLASAAS